MSNRTGDERLLDRRGFLKGSALFAAAAAVAASVSASAQEPPAPTEDKKEEPKKEEPAKKKPLIDKDGREYRVCDICGGNMYKEGKTWTCEQCGYSYEE